MENDLFCSTQFINQALLKYYQSFYWTKYGIFIVNSFSFNKIKRSLQSAGVQQVTEILTSRVGSAGSDEDKQVYKGLLAVWNQLILLNEENGMISMKSYILFNEGLESFLGYFKSYIPGTELREYSSKVMASGLTLFV